MPWHFALYLPNNIKTKLHTMPQALSDAQCQELVCLTRDNLTTWRERVLETKRTELRQIESLLLGLAQYEKIDGNWLCGTGIGGAWCGFTDTLGMYNSAVGTSHQSWEDVEMYFLPDVSSHNLKGLVSQATGDTFRLWCSDTYTRAFKSDRNQPLRAEIRQCRRLSRRSKKGLNELLRHVVSSRVARYRGSSKQGGLDLLNDEWNTSYRKWSSVQYPEEHDDDIIHSLQRRVVEDIKMCETRRLLCLESIRMFQWDVDVDAIVQSSTTMEDDNMPVLLRWWKAVLQSNQHNNVEMDRWYLWYVASAVRLRLDQDGSLPSPPPPPNNPDLLKWLQRRYSGRLERLGQEFGHPLHNWEEVESVLPDVVGFDEFYVFVSPNDSQRSFKKGWPSLAKMLYVHPTVSDGNCLFDAVALAVNSPVGGRKACAAAQEDGVAVRPAQLAVRAQQLRDILADSLFNLVDVVVQGVTYVWPEESSNPGFVEQRPGFVTAGWKVFADDAETTLPELEDIVRTTDWWGTHDAIRVLSHILGLRFIVLNSRGTFDCVGATVTSSQAYALLYYHEHLHYELLMDIKTKQGVFTLQELPSDFVTEWRRCCGMLDDQSDVTPVFTATTNTPLPHVI